MDPIFPLWAALFSPCGLPIGCPIVGCLHLCQHCQETELEVISRYLQVKTSEGINTRKDDVRKFSFHPKIRYDMGKEVFYIWIAIFDDTKEKKCHFYILNTKDVEKFDNIKLDTCNAPQNLDR